MPSSEYVLLSVKLVPSNLSASYIQFIVLHTARTVKDNRFIEVLISPDIQICFLQLFCYGLLHYSGGWYYCMICRPTDRTSVLCHTSLITCKSYSYKMIATQISITVWHITILIVIFLSSVLSGNWLQAVVKHFNKWADLNYCHPYDYNFITINKLLILLICVIKRTVN
jgi:hypothetical protein